METVKLDATVTRLVGGVGVYVKGKYSCTSGSGTTGKMAKLLGRNFIGIELDEKYYQIATKRIEAC